MIKIIATFPRADEIGIKIEIGRAKLRFWQLFSGKLIMSNTNLF